MAWLSACGRGSSASIDDPVCGYPEPPFVFFPDLPDIRLLNHRIAQVAGLYSLELNYTPLNGPMRIVKALEDRLLGLVLFIIFLPVMLIVAAVIKYQMGSPILLSKSGTA